MRIGAVDIGTNTMRLLIADVVGDDVRWLDRRTTVTGLGSGVDASGRLDDAAIGRTIDVLAGYGAALEKAGVEGARVVATSATRDAANRAAFLDLAEQAIGVRPDIISGDEEAALAFYGATRAAPGPAPFVVVDVGGGSTEFVFGGDAPEYLMSVDIGSVRLTDRALGGRPPDPDELASARDLAADLLAEVALPGPPGTCLGVAGTFTSLSAISQDLPVYDPGRVHGSVLTVTRIAELVLYLSLLSVGETAAIPSLDPARAPVILAGALVAEEAVRRCAVSEIVVSEHDSLDGVAIGVARS